IVRLPCRSIRNGEWIIARIPATFVLAQRIGRLGEGARLRDRGSISRCVGSHLYPMETIPHRQGVHDRLGFPILRPEEEGNGALIFAVALAAVPEWVLGLRAAVTTPRGVEYGPPLAKESDALSFMPGPLGARIDPEHHGHEVSRGGGHAGFAVETIVCRLETGPWPAPLSLI